MVAVFVHGVPETPDVWRPLVVELGDIESVTLRLPGFGSALPDGFEPTMQSYAEWLKVTLDGIAAPIDLVGHDWGALLTMRVVADGHPAVRSWVTDGGDLSPEYEWHDLAKAWQTPGVGEELMAAMLNASPEERVEMSAAVGIPMSALELFGDALDQTMADAILALYRSAADVGRLSGDALDHITVPSLVIHAAHDPFFAEGAVQAAADRIGAPIAPIDAGHWWMTENPARSAAILTDFWQTIPS